MSNDNVNKKVDSFFESIFDLINKIKDDPGVLEDFFEQARTLKEKENEQSQ